MPAASTCQPGAQRLPCAFTRLDGAGAGALQRKHPTQRLIVSPRSSAALDMPQLRQEHRASRQLAGEKTDRGHAVRNRTALRPRPASLSCPSNARLSTIHRAGASLRWSRAGCGMPLAGERHRASSGARFAGPASDSCIPLLPLSPPSACHARIPQAGLQNVESVTYTASAQPRSLIVDFQC